MSQRAMVRGSGNVVVQISGDGNTVVHGEPYLTLTAFEPKNRAYAEHEFLSPYTRATALVGRDAELNSLRGFLAAPASILVRVMTGGGGTGKTRLALELCDRARAEGWSAGFVTGRELQRFTAQQNFASWGWRAKTLMVVDYAAAHAESLATCIDELASRSPSAGTEPLRVLLLERHASTDAGWWPRVFARGGYGEGDVQALLDPRQPIDVAPLAVADRVTLFMSMLGKLAGGDAAQAQGLRQSVERLIGGGDPLVVMMAAHEYARSRDIGALSLGRTDLAERAAKREAKRLEDIAKAHHVGGEFALHLAACVTLAQGVSRSEFIDFAAREKAAIHREGAGDAAAACDALREALPRDESGIAPILPDLIGEAFVIDHLGKEPIGALRCFEAYGGRVAASAVRAFQDFHGPSGRGRAALAWLEAMAANARDDAATLAEIGMAFPEQSVELRPLQFAVVARRIELLTKESAAATAPELKARLQAEFAVAASALGRREPAFEAAQEAVQIYRELAHQRPDAFRPDLAGSLNNLAHMLSGLGQREPALQAAQEAVQIYRELAQQRPDAFRPDLAMSLNNLANMLSDLGRREPALQAAQEAVQIYRELAHQRPDAFRPDLAGSLNNLANTLSELGRREPALEAAQEAVQVYRELAHQRPDAFRPELAMSLNNLANRLSDLGRREPALQAAQEAVQIYRELAHQRPETFAGDLARSLCVLAQCIEGTQGETAAVPLAAEGIALLTPLFMDLPEAHAPLMQVAIGLYLRMVEAADLQPSEELLAPLMPYFTQGEGDA